MIRNAGQETPEESFTTQSEAIKYALNLATGHDRVILHLETGPVQIPRNPTAIK